MSASLPDIVLITFVIICAVAVIALTNKEPQHKYSNISSESAMTMFWSTLTEQEQQAACTMLTYRQFSNLFANQQAITKTDFDNWMTQTCI